MYPATTRQMSRLAALARQHGLEEPRLDLTEDEADDAIIALSRLRQPGARTAPPADEPDLAPNLTLRYWRPYR